MKTHDEMTDTERQLLFLLNGAIKTMERTLTAFYTQSPMPHIGLNFKLALDAQMKAVDQIKKEIGYVQN